MKHLFYCLFLMLLCVGCKGEDDPMTEEENNSSSATTRAPGSLDLSLSGNVVSISWNEPFGKYVGIEVGVSTESGIQRLPVAARKRGDAPVVGEEKFVERGQVGASEGLLDVYKRQSRYCSPSGIFSLFSVTCAVDETSL